MKERFITAAFLQTDASFTMTRFLCSEHIADLKEKLTRTYLHLVLHCVFCHPFIGPDADRRLWDLACDIASESVICELDLPCTRSDDDGRRRDMLRKIRRETGFLTAEKIYSSLRKRRAGRC